MKFYDRKRELALLQEYFDIVSSKGSRMLVITGRRRIGKTRLVLESTKNHAYLYFFVRKKRIQQSIIEWSEQVKQTFGNVFFGNFTNLEDFLKFLFEYSQSNPFVLIFDEVQNLLYSSPSEFATFQKIFDLYKEKSKILLIFTGSSYSLMERIFKHAKEPLFGRASEIITLSYLPIRTQKEILKDLDLYSGENLLHLFSIFDGIPKYIEELSDIDLPKFKQRISKLISSRELIWEEGENILKEEFGKEYSSYFSILSAIAKGRRKMNEIEQFTRIKNSGAYLKKLEKVYKLIERKLPVTSKSRKERKGRYFIRDNFFDFWFKFIDAKRNLKEIGKSELAFEEIWRGLKQYEGRKLENLFIRTVIEENPLNLSFNRIGKYWDRKGEIEIDAVLMDDINKICYLFEIKTSRKKITSKMLSKLENNTRKIPEFKDYQIMIGIVYLNKTGIKCQLISKLVN